MYTVIAQSAQPEGDFGTNLILAVARRVVIQRDSVSSLV